MTNILNQLELDFQTQLSKITFKWCKNYRYDFYFEFNKEQYIIETHGLQHYEESNRGISLKEEQEKDILKKELAISNRIKPENYIVIDCRYSKLDFIKQNILQSRLRELFDLSNIDWVECGRFACSNLVKEICDIKSNNPNLSVKDISKLTRYSTSIIRIWLKQGNEVGWCDYNAELENIKNRKSNTLKSMKQIEIFKEGISLGIFPSAKELERKSQELFGIKLDSGNISRACKGKRRHVKGYKFNYI
jgi:transposase